MAEQHKEEALTKDKLIGRQVIDSEGNLVGNVKDVAFTIGKPGIALLVETMEGESKDVRWEDVQAAGDVIVIKPTSAQVQVRVEQPQPEGEPKEVRVPTKGALPPPPPPSPKKRRTRLWAAASALIAIIVVANLFYFGFYFGFIRWPFKPLEEGGGEVTITSGNLIEVASQLIDYIGGTIEVTDSSSPLYGLRIEVPEAATEEAVTFTVSYSDIIDVSGLPENASVASKLIDIETSGSEIWNKYKAFDIPVVVTLPYDPSLVSPDWPVRFYYYDEESNVLDSAGFLWEDPTSYTVTFHAGTFSKLVGIALRIALYKLFGLVDTGFRPAIDGWFIPNEGSYLQPEGNCMGMSCYAKWYYTHKKPVTGVDLFEKYREGNKSEWRDDATAIQLATRAQLGAAKAFGWGLTWGAPVGSRWSSLYVAGTLLHGMLVTGEPQLIKLRTFLGGFPTPRFLRGQHMVLTYRYANGRFDIYETKYPGTEPGTDQQQIPWTYEEGFSRIYAVNFNYFEAVSSKVYYRAMNELYDAAEKKFKDDTMFPTVKFTDVTTTPQGTTPIDTDYDGWRDTNEHKVTISGTITGGLKSISSTLLFINGEKLQIPLVDGEFSQEVPLLKGMNKIVILATDENTRTNWAGYLQDFINCTAPEERITFTLTWVKDNSDLDLHVLEPTIDGVEGRHVYYGNRGGYEGGEHPYLDIDNTWGRGPEHYIATENMTLPNFPGPLKSLYGTYKVRVHYYADHDDDENNTQPIPWHLTVRYLAYKMEAINYNLWYEDVTTGVLTVANSSRTSDFYNTNPSWSPIWTVEYPEPEPYFWEVPPPPQNESED